MQLIIIELAGLITLILLVSGTKSRRWLLYLGLASIVVGHRGVYVGQQTYFVPLEVIIILLVGWLLTRESFHDKHPRIKLPNALIFVSLWCLIRGLISWLGGSSWDSIISWTLPSVIGLPIFWVIRYFAIRTEDLSTPLKILTIVSVCMSVLALIEYIYPGIDRLLPGIYSDIYISTPDGFARETFSFWGYPIGAVVVSWGMLISYYEIINPTNRKAIWIHIGIFVLCGVAVYISGQRSSWFGVAMAIMVLSISGKLKGWVGISGLVIGSSLLPAVFWKRLDTVTNYVQYGIVSDSSTASRLARWSWGWDNMIHNLLGGVGYGHWLVHNAFLEIGSTIGVIPAIVFLIFIIQLIWHIGKLALQGSTPAARRYGWLFLAFSVTWVVQLNVETIFQTPAIAVAFWPYMALAWYLPDIFKVKPEGHQPIQELV